MVFNKKTVSVNVDQGHYAVLSGLHFALSNKGVTSDWAFIDPIFVRLFAF
jgi:hypothetical protein